LEFAKLEAGVRGSLFALDYNIYGHLCEDTWITHLWKFTYDTGIEIEDDIENFELTRQGDHTLTSAFIAAYKEGIVSKSELKKANKCRLYLRVLTVADIASGDGRFVDDDMFKGLRNDARERALNWPVQGKPKSTDWGVWRKVIRQSLLNSQGQLLKTVGRWLPKIDTKYKGF
jgi:hypothetical protein